MYGFRKCGLCGKRMSLKYKDRLFGGEKIPDNFIILKRENEEDIFAHKACARKRASALKREDRNLKMTMNLNLGVISLGYEY